MYPYQNYLMNSYQQYQQPMYQQMQNPYMDKMQQLQSMQPQINQMQPMQQSYQNLSGRIVEDFNVITANDVPMDGNGAIFVKKDGSEIQVRNWTAQGTINTSVFKPVSVDQVHDLQGKPQISPEWLSQTVTGVFQNYFDRLNERLDKLEKSIMPLD